MDRSKNFLEFWLFAVGRLRIWLIFGRYSGLWKGIDYFRDNATSKDWKVVVNKNIAYNAIASSDCTNWEWDMADGVPDCWNPTGGNAKTGTAMVIPNSDLPSASNWDHFGKAYGTVKVFCEDGEGNNHTFYSTSMNASDFPAGWGTMKAEVYFDKWATTNPGGTVPNCFYYWIWTSASNGERTQTGGISYDGTSAWMGHYTMNDAGTNPIYVCGNLTNELGHVSIDEFSKTTIHEGLHRDHDAATGADTDLDFLHDTFETSDDLDLDYSRSHEAYTDTNANGQYDVGEPFVDTGLTRTTMPLGGAETFPTYGSGNAVWDQEGTNIPTGANVNITSKYHANTHGGGFDDEDDLCYAIEASAANADNEDWSEGGWNWNN